MLSEPLTIQPIFNLQKDFLFFSKITFTYIYLTFTYIISTRILKIAFKQISHTQLTRNLFLLSHIEPTK